jgi:hypothetical protein
MQISCILWEKKMRKNGAGGEFTPRSTKYLLNYHRHPFLVFPLGFEAKREKAETAEQDMSAMGLVKISDTIPKAAINHILYLSSSSTPKT